MWAPSGIYLTWFLHIYIFLRRYLIKCMHLEWDFLHPKLEYNDNIPTD